MKTFYSRSTTSSRASKTRQKKAEKYYEIKKEYREISIELAKASLEGFNLTWRDLNTQSEVETDKKIRLEAEIANEEATIEQEKVGFIEKERALQSMQHEFNDLLQTLRTKENDKNLASQRLNFLKERENSLQEFMNKSEGQLKGLEESIEFTTLQVTEEEGKLESLQQQLVDLKETSEEKRKVFDEKRVHVDSLRSENLNMQRNQFEAEKKVAIADNSIRNLEQSIARLEEEQEVRNSQFKQLEEEHITKEEELGSRQRDLQQLQEHHERTKEQILQTQGEMERLRQTLAEESRKLDAKRMNTTC
ncbi:hypothetical protein [Paraflavitalea speifideaquila]|uniref:hypothetical protein n=1 Tax=Paraflavitalea speifideaquila TaxID=3076558 RepID=UPI0028E6963A|nr:hypothetical protein [Paraflavitalea speifideiaquila]